MKLVTKQRIINCHTHIFTADHVPPLLARSLVTWPLYYLLPLTPFVRCFRWWYRSKYSPYCWPSHPWYKKVARGFYLAKMSLSRYWILRLLKLVIGLLIIVSLFHTFYRPLIKPLLKAQEVPTHLLDQLDDWLTNHGILIITDSWLLKIFLLIVLLLFFPSGRNLLWFLLRQTFRFLKMLPGKQTLALLKRYIDIVRFARYKRQSDIFTKLTNQYPPGSAMIVLPMDMAFMGAGDPPFSYEIQMEGLAKLKENRPEAVYPFVFIDPRRKKVGKKDFFAYRVNEGKVELQDCFIKDYIETKGFSGFKIYPALGYYPFDEVLLPLWKYAADNNIPIMTHCIRGVIYYRGPKKKDWDYHPVFKQAMGKRVDPNVAVKRKGPAGEPALSGLDGYAKMLLPQTKRVNVQEIFTHPLNYACLLKKELLCELVSKSSDPRIKELFAYDEMAGTIQHGLENLKICFAHFGGEDEWARFLKKDRDNYTSQLERKPNHGIDFLTDGTKQAPGKPEQIWRSVDWYSIIISLMLQYDNVYGDISYILHGKEEILPLLKKTLQHPKLRQRVLYGSDFYVVRNHKTDKHMLADIMGDLDMEDFDQIARNNPQTYLSRT